MRSNIINVKYITLLFIILKGKSMVIIYAELKIFINFYSFTFTVYNFLFKRCKRKMLEGRTV